MIGEYLAYGEYVATGYFKERVPETDAFGCPGVSRVTHRAKDWSKRFYPSQAHAAGGSALVQGPGNVHGRNFQRLT